jgi:ergothioneine biosynthesis protein EgtB
MTPVREVTEAVLLGEAFCQVRQQSERLCQPLSAEDMMVQSLPEASPAKWHMAHTAWFFETFLLSQYFPSYGEYDPKFRWLFNSYYNSISDQPEKKLRASFSRPGVEQILNYRRHVDEGMQRLIQSDPPQEAVQRIVLGLHHEQQHQELLATDIKHALWTNPLQPAYIDDGDFAGKLGAVATGEAAEWVEYEGGLYDVGFAGDGFAFDIELPRHPFYLQPFRLRSRPVSCAEYLEFMEDGGYQRPELWLSAGWNMVKAEQWQAPLYWRKSESRWRVYTMHGELGLEALSTTPVCHVSYFEADAFARWAGRRLPGEEEWEIAAQPLPVTGNLLEDGILHPRASRQPFSGTPVGIFGDVWEWTASAYLGYPGFRPAHGALGEYNGKFMSGQMVLRGGSAVTPASHIRATYRNFFSPETRWQFSGIRLAEG